MQRWEGLINSPKSIMDVSSISSTQLKFGKLTFKLSLLVIFLIILSLAIFSTVFLLFERNKTTEDIYNNGIVFAEFATSDIYSNYLNYYTHGSTDDFAVFKDQINKTLSKNKDIVHVNIIGTNGIVLFDSDELVNGKYTGQINRTIKDDTLLKMVKQEETTSRAVTTNDGKTYTEIVSPLKERSGGHVISMRYMLSYNSLQNRLIEIYYQIAIFVVPLLIFGILTSVFFSIKLTGPIIELKRATEGIAKGDFEVHVKARTNDEIGELAHSFNKMTEDLKKSHAETEEYKRTLEQRVADRTKELAMKAEELERMNKLMIGRELKMVELKKEIAALKGEEKKAA